MNNRFVIFIVLSIITLVGFNYFSVKNRKPVSYSEKEADLSKRVVPEPKKTFKPTRKERGLSKKVQTVAIENSKIKIEASSDEAKINHVIIKEYSKKGEKEFDLIEKNERQEYLIWQANVNGEAIEHEAIAWEAKKEANKIVFQAEPLEDVIIIKEIELSQDDYQGKIRIIIENNKRNEIQIDGCALHWGPLKHTKENRFNVKKAVVLQGREITRIKTKKKRQKRLIALSDGWAGMQEQYFCAIFSSPEKQDIKSVEIINSEDSSLDIELNLKDKIVQPHSRIGYEIGFYFGPQEYQRLKSLGNNFHKIVYFGWFHVIGVAMLYILNLFHKITGNYGVAIILLTVLIRVILWWPTQKSYTSMKKMQGAMSKMQPRIKTLKELYKNNPAKLNEETMKLYKEYQINPMGGCLPMLLQMPVFFALYKTLTTAVELRGAKFVWMWQDLSSKDPAYILPFAMGASMFIQQKMSTPPAATPESATQQKMMLYLMPVMLTFFSFMWPSGLLLYWVVSNILSIGQQVLINRKV